MGVDHHCEIVIEMVKNELSVIRKDIWMIMCDLYLGNGTQGVSEIEDIKLSKDTGLTIVWLQ